MAQRENVTLTPAEVDQVLGVLYGCYAALRDLKRAYSLGDDYPMHADATFEELGDFMYPSSGEPLLPTCGSKLEAWLDAEPPAAPSRLEQVAELYGVDPAVLSARVGHVKP